MSEAKKYEPCRISYSSGMGNLHNPPTHPEHTQHVSMGRSGSMCLSFAATCDYIDPSVREFAARTLADWEKVKPDLSRPEMQEWIKSVLAYFAGCYKGDDALGDKAWEVSNLRIWEKADPMLNIDLHAGVRFIRKYYPEFVPVASDFRGTWGKKKAEKATA